jgi:hypothetical protein
LAKQQGVDMTTNAATPWLARWSLALVVLVAGALLLSLAPDEVVHAERNVRQLQRDFQSAKRDGQPSAMIRAVNELGDSDDDGAARFLLGELQTDQRMRAQNRGGLPGRVRDAIVHNLGKFRNERSVDRIGSMALGLNSESQPELTLDQYDFFSAMARMDGVEAAEATLRSAIGEGRNPYVKVAAIEAARGAGARKYVPEIRNVLLETNKAWAEQWTIVPINVFEALRTLVDSDDRAEVIATVEAAIVWEERKWCNCERVHFFGTRMLRELTGEKANMKSVAFWKWWVAQVKAQADIDTAEGRPQSGESRTASRPPVFDTEIIGLRHVFVIDVSESMQLPLRIDLDEIQRRRERRGPVSGERRGDKDEEEEERRRAAEEDPLRQLPWQDIRTRLDLAREELSRAIRMLPPGLKFAIVVYSTDVRVLTDGFVDSTPANTARWSREARELKLESMTNIHGALMQALRVSDRGISAQHPSVDRDCVLTGADTIVFMTDGWATWDDQSNIRVEDPRNRVPASIGDGPYIMGEDIWPDILRHNRFRKVIINTVGIGNHDKELMRVLARETGGTYVDWSFPD